MTQPAKQSFLQWLARPESLVGLSAVIVSVVAVTVSAYEARIMRQWQRAAVWPYVQLSRSFYYDPDAFKETGERNWRLTLNAENTGTGPAKIADFRVFVDGKPYPTWGAALAALSGDDKSPNYGQSSINGLVIPVGQSIQMLQYTDPANVEKIYAEMSRMDFQACYCSVFDECWLSSYSGFGEATPVKSCTRDETSFKE